MDRQIDVMKLIVSFHSFANVPKKGHKGEGACRLFGVLQIVMTGVEHEKAKERKQSYVETSEYSKVNIFF
jgi:hypothetical protein